MFKYTSSNTQMTKCSTASKASGSHAQVLSLFLSLPDECTNMQIEEIHKYVLFLCPMVAHIRQNKYIAINCHPRTCPKNGTTLLCNNDEIMNPRYTKLGRGRKVEQSTSAHLFVIVSLSQKKGFFRHTSSLTFDHGYWLPGAWTVLSLVTHPF